MKINKEEIYRLIEGQTIEFKKSLSEMRKACKTLCGMLNSDISKGTIIFGISPDGSINGIESGNLDSAQKTLVQHIKQKFEPSLIINIEILECEDKTLIKLEANREKPIPYYEYDGRAYIREGSTTRQLTLQEKQLLRKKRDRSQYNGLWKCNRCGAIFVPKLSSNITDQDIEKTYYCDCGGELRPIN